MGDEERKKSLPLIQEMPTIRPETWEAVWQQFSRHGEAYGFILQSEFAKDNPNQREAYRKMLAEEPYREWTPNATSFGFLITWEALRREASRLGARLPDLPSKVNPVPALEQLRPEVRQNPRGILRLAFSEIRRVSPTVEAIVERAAQGAPTRRLKQQTRAQMIEGIVYAYFGVKSELLKGAK